MAEREIHAFSDEFTPTFSEREGLLFVDPYLFPFRCLAKREWVGSLRNGYMAHFKHRDEEYYLKCMEAGLITVNGERVTADDEVTVADEVTHMVHRHEAPILPSPIMIIEETDDYIAVRKPCSMVTTPVGRFRYNSLTQLMYQRFGRVNALYRLDRVTSGLLVFGKTSAFVSATHKLKTRKVYLARVLGHFPEGDSDDDGYVRIDAPIHEAGPRSSHRIIHPDGKDSTTFVRRLSIAGGTSLVECVLGTGRTHQIRVHLEHVGYPICDDIHYGGWAALSIDAWTPPAGADVIVVPTRDGAGTAVHAGPLCAAAKALCETCASPDGELPAADLLQICLHAHRLTCDGIFDLVAPPPPWADDDFCPPELQSLEPVPL